MPDNEKYETQNLRDYEELDASDTLAGPPGDDPLDRGLVPPYHWSAAEKFGTTAEEQQAGESLDQLLAEEEPDEDVEFDDDLPEAAETDEEAGDEDVDGLLLDDGPDPRSGRLVAEDQGAPSPEEPDLAASDVGIDGGAATAEEAAVHIVEDDDNDVRSGD